MAAKRNRLEIIKDILIIIKENKNAIRLTPLLRKSNLSSSGFAEYFEELQSKGFVKKDEDKKGNKIFSVTEKGFRYLEKYKSIIGFLEEFEL